MEFDLKQQEDSRLPGQPDVCDVNVLNEFGDKISMARRHLVQRSIEPRLFQNGLVARYERAFHFRLSIDTSPFNSYHMSLDYQARCNFAEKDPWVFD